MKVFLTNNPKHLGVCLARVQSDCDCDCACPVGSESPPVLALPAAYYLELTSNCNNRCPGCGNVYALERTAGLVQGLDGAAWRRLIGRLSAHATHFKLTGGEPTLHPDFAGILYAVEDAGVPFTLFSNGRWPQPAALLSRLEGLQTCQGVLVSLHGPDAPSHQAFSGAPGSFDETVSNVRRLAECGIDVALSLVISRDNWDCIEETLELGLSLGANHLVCNRFIGPSGAAIAPSQRQLRAAVRRVEALRAAGRPVRFGNCIPQCFEPSSSRGCAAGSTFATIDPWGRLRPCNHAPLVMGDLGTDPIETLWHSPQMDDWRALLPAGCSSCAALSVCHGGCRAQALLNGHAQDPLMRNPLLNAPRSSQEQLLLYAGLRPLGQFVHRAGDEDNVLLHRGQAVTAPANCAQLAVRLDGSLTLQQIEQTHGQAALDWIGGLRQSGLLVWASVQGLKDG